MVSTTPAVPVTLAEIARLAGVGRAAVSNWRRRHESFPARIGGTDVSPQFSLTEIEAWLRDNGKLKKAAEREWLWPQFEALGGRDATGFAIAAAGRLMSGDAHGPVGIHLSAEARELAQKAANLGRREGPSDAFEFLLRRWLDANVRQISTTPEPLAALMVDLAQGVRLGADAGGHGDIHTVLDPGCGTGHLLAAAAAAHAPVTLLGCDRDPVLAALADARLALLSRTAEGSITADVRSADSLRADPLADVRADVVLCNPPFNERDWGYEELATDARWVHGMPPRTEPELAWVQHCVARLEPGGAAVVLLPPAVASRRAGRRIRGSLLRSGLLRAVVALPPGCAAPHSVSLQLWVLYMPRFGSGPQGSGELLLVDAASRFPRTSAHDAVPDWGALAAFVRSALGAAGQPGERADTRPQFVTSLPVIDLLDDEVDLTPGRHITPPPSAVGSQRAESWKEFDRLVAALGDTGGHLSSLEFAGGEAGAQPTTTVGELARAEALTLRGGQQPTEGTVCEGRPADDGVPLLTVPDLLMDGEPHGWLTRADAEATAAVLAQPGDVIVVGVARAFAAWVHDGPPTALGPQLYALTVHPDQLDAWFLAGSLRAPANARQAGTHASSSSRVDVRKLQVRQIGLAEQRRYGEVFRQVADFEKTVRQLHTLGTGLVRDLADELAAGRMTAEA
ncbi:N-6 DNA methylase [Streptomyces rubradiris]|uniref:Type II restriction endonuclease subunit M n=1 Tax=Streptomyces rubradiris TaxID=285531 RepID=A0ABQ3RCM1_STRRR|nr:N-6 DNA methylase [Streptomyces rubradiris]GHG93944.1 type II restriction endonuclease subunit M [Streptomyces rubradiris]GHI53607.1 type II restriction endonuclease subunit M [Streptomyces rubradiris]